MLSERFYELPISNLSFFLFSNLGNLGTLAHFRHFCLPWGGGGYFRLIPSWIFRKGVRRILSEQGGYLFYMHPWEIDPEQPRVKEAPRSFRFRHYVNLSGTEKKFINMLSDFSDCRFLTCHEYLKENA